MSLYNKFYLKSEIRFNTIESFQRLYTPVILTDSVYRKNRNYYSKVILDIVAILMKNIIIKNV